MKLAELVNKRLNYVKNGASKIGNNSMSGDAPPEPPTMETKVMSADGIIIINFSQNMIVPSEEIDYSKLFEFEAVSILDGSSTLDEVSE